MACANHFNAVIRASFTASCPVASMALSVGVGEDNYIAGELRESAPPMW